MKGLEIINCIEQIAPLAYQEDYDNSGLIIGNDDDITGILITLDITEEVIEEAINLKTNFVLSHHPLIFSGIKKITGKNYIERSIIKAIKNDINIYAAHTNFDNIENGVNIRICKKLGLINTRILSPRKGELRKLVTFVPTSHANKVREAIFNAGAGHIGNYDSCSYNITGQGTFRGDESTNPFVGEKGKLHFEEEVRIETIFTKHLENNVVQAMIKAHPYEEVAYDIYPLNNEYSKVGSGMIGEFEKPVEEKDCLKKIKEAFNTKVVKHTKLLGKSVSKVAVCGGSGSFLLKPAMAAKADIFVSADFKYHQFFDTENEIVIADIGHFESEQCTLEVFYELLNEKFHNFAIHLSKVNTNPTNYI